MLSLTVRQVIQSGSSLVSGSVFSVIEAYDWMVLLCKIFQFHHVVWISWTLKISVVHSL